MSAFYLIGTWLLIIKTYERHTFWFTLYFGLAMSLCSYFVGGHVKLQLVFIFYFFSGGGGVLNLIVIRKYRNAHALQCENSKARVTHC